MSLFDKLKSSLAKDYSSEKKADYAATSNNDHKEDAPPTYAPTDDTVPSYAATDPISEAAAADLNSAFANLSISQLPSPFPEVEHCLVHLKLLSAFHALKEEVGFTDGLFDIQDSSCEKSENKLDALATLREKRWSLYVARAAERFQEWWLKVLCTREEAVRITTEGLKKGTAEIINFPQLGKPQVWTTAMLPPLDVLMVWHTFMLNPRNYLEDCARLGLKNLWATGLPWAAVNTAIDREFNYDTPEEAKISFVGSTGLQWDNCDDPLTKVLNCPGCNALNEVPWTTCGGINPARFAEIPGTGWGDRGFVQKCSSHACEIEINHKLLRVYKFINDTESLILNDWPLGGTILSSDGALSRDATNTGFVNRLVQIALRQQILELKHKAPTMSSIRDLIEKALVDKAVVRKVNVGVTNVGSTVQSYERFAIRKMMSKYWDNSSVLTLELGGAVIRQSLFVDKMHKIDWLHSPAAKDTMKRLLIKYGRFINIMAANPLKTAIPTLDVDLGWHTHQLLPQQYFTYTMETSKKFINHDDKISEDKISEFFEQTSEIYQNTYKEVYSECTCWYCETIRSRHSSSKIFGASKLEKPVDEWYKSGAAALCKPDQSAHISTHNSVRIDETAIRKQIFDRTRRRNDAAMEASYLKACKKAEQKGRKKPDRDAFYYNHWGSPYMMAMPFVAVPVVVGGVYFAGDTCSMPQGNGMEGACVAGTCSGAAGVGLAGATVVGGGGGCGGGCGGGGGGGCGGS